MGDARTSCRGRVGHSPLIPIAYDKVGNHAIPFFDIERMRINGVFKEAKEILPTVHAGEPERPYMLAPMGRAYMEPGLVDDSPSRTLCDAPI